jgi:hypothetical protein
MKKLILTSVVTFGLALGAFAQGQIILQNQNDVGLWDYAAGDYFSTAGNTPITIQVWYAANDSYINTINSANVAGDVATSSAILSANYTLIGTFYTTVNYGGFMVGGDGTATFPSYTGPGSTSPTLVPLAIAIWTGTSTSLADALACGDMGGVISFMNNVSAGGTDPGAPLYGWEGPTGLGSGGVDQWINMNVVPEPTTIALGIMGLSTLLLRRRK